jgi:RNA polymerase sigma-70 factor, ECF subfamily
MSKKPLPSKAMLESNNDFEEAYKEYSGRIYRFLLWRTHDRELSEDLTSSVFVKAWRSRLSFTGGSTSAWFFRIAHNTLTDHWRKKKEVTLDDIDAIPDDRPTSEEALDTALEAARLQKAVSKLPEQMSVVITRRFINGQSTRQVAAALNLSEGNVRIIQYRALKRLRRYLS